MIQCYKNITMELKLSEDTLFAPCTLRLFSCCDNIMFILFLLLLNKHSLLACIFTTSNFARLPQCVYVTYLFSPRELQDINSHRMLLSRVILLIQTLLAAWNVENKNQTSQNRFHRMYWNTHDRCDIDQASAELCYITQCYVCMFFLLLLFFRKVRSVLDFSDVKWLLSLHIEMLIRHFLFVIKITFLIF